MPEYKQPEPAEKPPEKKQVPKPAMVPSPVRTKMYVYDVKVGGETYRVSLPEPLKRDPNGKYGQQALTQLKGLFQGDKLLPHESSNPNSRIIPRADVVAQGNSKEATEFNKPKLLPNQVEDLKKSNPKVPEKELVVNQETAGRVDTFGDKFVRVSNSNLNIEISDYSKSKTAKGG